MNVKFFKVDIKYIIIPESFDKLMKEYNKTKYDIQSIGEMGLLPETKELVKNELTRKIVEIKEEMYCYIDTL